MARVERTEQNQRDNSDDDTQRQQQKREVIGRTPDKAEDDENTVDEALRNQEETGRR